MTSKPQVAVVVPAYNEQGKIGTVVRRVRDAATRLSEVDISVVVVDDASKDDTGAEASGAGAVVLRHETNRGVGAGIRTGIDWAIQSGRDIVAVISGDDQHDPTELGRVLAPILAGECDFVQGSRWLRGGGVVDAPWSRRLSTRLYSAIMSLVTCRRCTDGTNGLRAFRTSLLRDRRINLQQECLDGYELEPYLLYKVLTLGCRVREVPITIRYHQDHGGCTKMKPFRDWWRIFRPLLFLRLGIWT